MREAPTPDLFPGEYLPTTTHSGSIAFQTETFRLRTRRPQPRSKYRAITALALRRALYQSGNFRKTGLPQFPAALPSPPASRPRSPSRVQPAPGLNPKTTWIHEMLY